MPGSTPLPLRGKSSLTSGRKPYDPFQDFFENFSLDSSDDELLSRKQRLRLDRIMGFKRLDSYIFQQPSDSKSGPLISLDGEEFKLLSSYDYPGDDLPVVRVSALKAPCRCCRRT